MFSCISKRIPQPWHEQCLERILYVWAIRHPASGYVQGINDLVTPFFQVFLSAYIGMRFLSSRDVDFHSVPDSDPELCNPSQLPAHVLNAIEADSFWCLSRLLDGIQDNYISAQPGIQRSVRRMAELVARIDGTYIMFSRNNNKLKGEICAHSATLLALGISECGIHTFCL